LNLSILNLIAKGASRSPRRRVLKKLSYSRTFLNK
jgi:hypothetical protein